MSTDLRIERPGGPVPDVTAFFDPTTHTVSYVVREPAGPACAILDPVLDFEAASGRIAHRSAGAVVDLVRREGLRVEWIIETHVHADHLSAAPWVQQQVGGRIAIGQRIDVVQDTFGRLFNEGPEFRRDGSQFDHLFADGEAFAIGQLQAQALHTPGHTPACMAYLVQAADAPADGSQTAAFVGDTLFMPDYGTARCDFPGGDARTLWRSIQRLLALPPATRLYMCHDYQPGGREVRFE
ncbi:MAG: MBL fold metallo-hydrolase, partial [Lysobacteraceae bacterium]